MQLITLLTLKHTPLLRGRHQPQAAASVLGALSASVILAGSAHAMGLGMVWAGWLQPLPTPEQLLTTFPSLHGTIMSGTGVS